MGKECGVKMTKMEGRSQKTEDRSRKTEARNPSSVVCPPSCVSRRRGIALIWTAVTLTVLILFVGLALDGARLFLVATQLHNAADGAALAGAQVVKFDETGARALAIDTAGQNYADGLSVFLRPSIQPDPWPWPRTMHPAMRPEFDVLIGRWVRQERWFYPTLYSPNAVMALGRREGLSPEGPPIALLLMPLAKIYTANLRRYAVARCRGATGAGIETLSSMVEMGTGDPTDPFFSVPPGCGNAGLRLSGAKGCTIDLRGFDPVTGEPMVGEIHINSTSFDQPKAALYIDGSPQIYAAEVTMCGTSNPPPPDPEDPSTLRAWEALYGDPSLPFSVYPDEDRMEDPLIELDPPPFLPIPSDKNGKPYTYTIDNQTIKTGGNPVTDASGKILYYELRLQPGYYPGGINVTQGGHRIVLTGGQDAIYEFGGGTDSRSGVVINNAALVEDVSVGDVPPNDHRGVMLYITGDPTGSLTGTVTQYGQVNIGGNAEILITPRGDWTDPKVLSGELGVSIWQDRSNPNQAIITGTSDFLLKGTLYFGYNHLTVAGDSVSCGNQILAGAMEVKGSLTLGVAYDGRNRDNSNNCCLVQ